MERRVRNTKTGESQFPGARSTYDAKLSSAKEVANENLSNFEDSTRPCDAVKVFLEVLSEAAPAELKLKLLVDGKDFSKLWLKTIRPADAQLSSGNDSNDSRRGGCKLSAQNRLLSRYPQIGFSEECGE